MSPRQYPDKRDENEAPIVKLLQSLGCVVVRLSPGGGVPDLLIGGAGRTTLLEIKNPGAKAPSGIVGQSTHDPTSPYMGMHPRLTTKQADWHLSWKGSAPKIAETGKQAVRVLELCWSCGADIRPYLQSGVIPREDSGGERCTPCYVDRKQRCGVCFTAHASEHGCPACTGEANAKE